MEKLPFFLVFIGSWLSISGGIYVLFNRAGENVDPKTKIAVSKWLKNVDIFTPEDNWPSTFVNLFDRVFGIKHFTWKCFYRSSIASFIALFIVSFIYFIETKSYHLSMDLNLRVIIALIVGYLIFNLTLDYLSLLLSRYVLGLMVKTRSVIKLTLLVIADSVSSFFGALFIMNILIMDPSWELSEIYSGFKRNTAGILDFESLLGFIGVFIYTSLFTSLWIWLYIVSGFSLKLLNNTQISIDFLKKHLDIKNKPFTAMGFTSMLLITVVYLIYGVIILIR